MKYHTFKPQFHPLILAGTKGTTIRGSTRVRAGDRFALRCWTGRPYGSPMGWLATATAQSVAPITIAIDDLVVIDGLRVLPAHLDTFAVRDGFPDWPALREYFADRMPFAGVHIAWRDLVPGAP